jgi:hypothetical protein
MTTHKSEKKLVDNIKMNLREVCYEDKSWTVLAHDHIYSWFWISDAEHSGTAIPVLDQCVPKSTDCTLASMVNVKVRTGLRRSVSNSLFNL